MDKYEEIVRLWRSWRVVSISDADGNGRVGRTLLNYFLMTHDHPPLIVYDENKAVYYAALEVYDKSEDIEPMVHFLRFQTERTWEKTLGRERKRGAIEYPTESIDPEHSYL